MAEQKDKLAERQYYDIGGYPCSLEHLVRSEPDWAASRIRESAKQEARVVKLLAFVEAAKRMRGFVDCREDDGGAADEFDAALAALEEP